MSAGAATAKHFRSYSRRRLLWRSLLAAPFALSLVLVLIIGPATVDNPHASFAWLVAWSLLATLGMLVLADALLIPLGLATLVAFPLLAGLGFQFAPTWAGPIVAALFYGSILTSLAAAMSGTGALLRLLVRGHWRPVSIGVGGVALLGLGLIVPMTGAPAGTLEPAAASVSSIHNMGSIINTAQREAEPTFSADGRTMIFNCHNDDICVSYLEGAWEAGQWSQEQLLPAPITSPFQEIEPWLSPAGDKLYFNSNRPYASGESLPGLALWVNAVGLVTGQLGITPLGGIGQDEIWVSHLRDGQWSDPTNLSDVPGEPPVNTAYMDHCLAFSADGNEAFWTSTRPGGSGGNDIWTSLRVLGSWTAPENVGPKVNSAASEHHSLPTPDGRHLEVTSDRSSGFGGDDMYVAVRQPDGTWGPLVNLGSQINGPGNDRCAAWTPDGRIFLLDSDQPGGFGSKDLWWVHMEDAAPTSAGGG